MLVTEEPNVSRPRKREFFWMALTALLALVAWGAA